VCRGSRHCRPTNLTFNFYLPVGFLPFSQESCGILSWNFPNLSLGVVLSEMLSISWQEHRTNDSILTELGLERELMERVTKLKLQYFGHITRGSARQLALTVLEGIMEGLRHQGRPRRQWIHDIEEWTGCEYIQLDEMSQDRAQWRRKISEWSSAVANPHRGRSTSEWLSRVIQSRVQRDRFFLSDFC